MGKETENNTKWWIKYLGTIILILTGITIVLWLMTIRIQQGYTTIQEEEKETGKEYFTIDEIVNIDCSEVTSIQSTLGEISDEAENSDMDVLLNKRFQIQSSETDFPHEKAIYIKYAFHGTDENGYDYILFWAQQDIVNNTWSFSVTENFTDVYYPV